MSIKSIPTAHRENLEKGSPGDVDTRVFADFRQIDYPDVGAGSPTFTLAREDNLIDRGNCESATAPGILGETGSVFNVTLARSADFKHGGDYSMKVTKGAAVASTGVFLLTDSGSAGTTDMHGFVAGTVNEISASIYVPTAGGPQISEVYLYMRYYDAPTTAWVNTRKTLTGSADTWNKISETFTIASTATGAYFYFAMSADASNTEYFYVDDIIVKRHSVPGSHYLSGGYSEHLVELADTGTIQIKFKSTFAFDIGANQFLFGWYVSGTQECYITYRQVNNTFVLIWEDGGTMRLLASAPYDDGSAQRNINQWITLTLAFDPASGRTGSSLWMNKIQDDTDFGAVPDLKSTTFNKMQLRAYNGTAGAFDIAYALYIPNYVATDADVQNDFKDVLDEQIYFSLDGHSTGATRCNISKFTTGLTYSKNVANRLSGAASANRVSIDLKNIDGEFSDDQYAAFNAAGSVYNGLVSQKYITKRPKVRIENHYGGDFDNLYVGRVDPNGFARTTVHVTKMSMVSVSCADRSAELATRRVRNGTFWEDKKICEATLAGTNSLMHLITRLGTNRYVRNYAHNSGFENATIGTAWKSTTLTLSRDTSEEYFGAACAKLVYDNVAGGTQNIYQSISFDNDEKLNIGETWTWEIYLKCADAFSKVIRLKERDSGGENDETTKVYTIAGGEGYVPFEISHTITDSDSDELRFQIDTDDNVTAYADGCMLVKGNRAPKYYIDNTAETLDADDYAESSYQTHGFDTVEVDVTHPWKRVEEGIDIFTYVKGLADASASMYVGYDANGTFRFRAALETSFTDPIAIDTIDDETALSPLYTSLTLVQANKIVGRGVIIKTQTKTWLLWDAISSGMFDIKENSGYLNEAIANAATWPASATYGQFWAKYNMKEIAERTNEFIDYNITKPQWRWHVSVGLNERPIPAFGGYWSKRVVKQVPYNYKVLGITSPILSITKYSPNSTGFTQTIFDTTSKADSARILLTNSSGNEITLYNAQLWGIPTVMLCGDNGRIHDAFVDYEDIEKHGEELFEFGNEDVVTKAQLESLADYWWKYNRNLKHVYHINYPGELHWLQPGDWVRLDFGAVGEPEYIDSIAEVYDVQIDRTPQSGGRTNLVCIEVEEAWKKDSNAISRTMANSGLYNITPASNYVFIASSTGASGANVYCDGTADEVQINAVIVVLSNIGGGIVHLGPGTFKMAAAIAI